MQVITVVPHNPQWQDLAEQESSHIAAALGENVVAVHHIGSTAIPNIYAKPVIDLLVEVRDINQVEEQTSTMQRLGYEVKGEFGIAGRRYFRKDNEEGIRTHQIHTFESGSPHISRHLAFREYLIAHPEAAQKYSDLKRTLAAEHQLNMAAYIDGKDEFIKDIDRQAKR